MRIKPIAIDLKKENLSNTVAPTDVQHLILNNSKTSLAKYVQRLAYSKDGLIVSLGNSLKLHDHEVARGKTFLGRIMGRITSATDPDWIDIDGTKLLQLYQFTELEPPIELSASQVYCAETAGLRLMLSKLQSTE